MPSRTVITSSSVGFAFFPNTTRGAVAEVLRGTVIRASWTTLALIVTYAVARILPALRASLGALACWAGGAVRYGIISPVRALAPKTLVSLELALFLASTRHPRVHKAPVPAPWSSRIKRVADIIRHLCDVNPARRFHAVILIVSPSAHDSHATHPSRIILPVI